MRIEVLPDADSAAQRAADLVAAEVLSAVEARGRATVALSGGRTPWQMLRQLATRSLPWSAVHLFQVDERVAPAGHADRNLTHLRESLPSGQLHAMPVEEPDLAAAAARYAGELEALAGTPPVLDLVQLGLGPDGHTASLFPGDPALELREADVAVTGAHQGRVRMTLTFPALDRARRILWLVTGSDKSEMLARLRAGDRSIPAGRVRGDRALILADAAAVGETTRSEAGCSE